MAIINPVVTPHKNTKRVNSIEGCLSFPGKQVKIKRAKRVTLTGYDVDWLPVEIGQNTGVLLKVFSLDFAFDRPPEQIKWRKLITSFRKSAGPDNSFKTRSVSRR